MNLDPKRWYVLQTKPRQESVAREHIDRQGFEVFLPWLEQSRRRRGAWVDVVEPLFPRYLFVRADPERDNLALLRSTRGVTGLVRFGMELIAVPDDVMAALQAAGDENAKIQLTASTLFVQGEEVTILDGPFAGLKAIFEAESGEQRAIILLDILGRPSRIKVPTNSLGKCD